MRAQEAHISQGTIHMTPTKPRHKLDWERIKIALNWDLTKPKEFMVKREGKEPSYVEIVAKQYLRYLGIIAAYPADRFPVSEPVDEMWHTHILFTRDYRKMSDAVRGEYINHDPVITDADRQPLMPYYHKGTLVRYRQLYGTAAPRYIWPVVNGAICWSGYDILPLQH